MEALLYTEQDLLRFVNNLVAISKLLLYVRAYGMPYKRDETPNRSDKIRTRETLLLAVLGEFLRSCVDVRLQLTEETKGDILKSFKRFMRFLLFFDRDEFTLLDWGQLNLLNSQIA